MNEDATTAESAQYLITLDTDSNSNDSIAQATGIESKWFKSHDSFHDTDVAPVAVFLDARMAMEGSTNGSLIPKLKDNWPLSPIILISSPDDSEIVTEAMAPFFAPEVPRINKYFILIIITLLVKKLDSPRTTNDGVCPKGENRHAHLISRQ